MRRFFSFFSQTITPISTKHVGLVDGTDGQAGGPDGPADVTDGPAGGPDGPADGTDGPAGGPDGPADGTDDPAGGPDGPADGTDGPAGGPDGPAGGPDGPADGLDQQGTNEPADGPDGVGGRAGQAGERVGPADKRTGGRAAQAVCTGPDRRTCRGFADCNLKSEGFVLFFVQREGFSIWAKGVWAVGALNDCLFLFVHPSGGTKKAARSGGMRFLFFFFPPISVGQNGGAGRWSATRAGRKTAQEQRNMR